MKVIPLLSVLITFTSNLFAQVPTLGDIFITANTDSLAKTLPQKTGIAKLSTLLSLCKSMSIWNIHENTPNIFTDQLVAMLKKNPEIRGHYLYFMSKKKASNNRPQEAYNFSNLAYEYYKAHNDTTGMVSALLNMGTMMADGEKASPKNIQFGHKHLAEAVALCKNSSNPELRILFSYAFARIVGKEAFNTQSDKLITELKKGLLITHQYPQYICYKPFLLNMLSLIYESKQQFQESQKYTLEIVQIYRQYHPTNIPLAVLYNLAFFNEMLCKYELALDYYKQSMKIAHSEEGGSELRFERDISMGIHASLVGLHKYKEAAIWADSIYEYAEKFTLYSVNANLQKAVVEYEVEKKEARTRALEQEKQLVQAQNKLILSVGLAITIALLAAAFLLYRLRQANFKLKNAYDEILQLHQVRDYFFGIIAHDLRSPLNSFHEMAEIIKFHLETKRFDELKKIADGIDQMGLRIRILLDNLLSWALSQRQEVPHSPENLLLYERLSPITNLYQQITAYKQIAIIVECPTDLTVYMDSNACDLIIRNLVDNASKHLRKGGKIIIKATYNETNKQVALTIEDDGVGISPEKLSVLTNTLNHPEISNNTPRGLGMILIGRFMKSNKISFDVKSNIGQGTIFTLMIPSSVT